MPPRPMARNLKADCIVSVGGGSVIDTAKAVCVTLKNGGKANDHIAMQRLQEPQTPHIVIPTTSGTGSEVTNVAVIKSKTAGRKVYIVDTQIVPNVAILDPRFTMTLPPGLTVTTAMDAMTHAVEALTSTMSQPICDGQALQAIRLIAKDLPMVVADPKDENRPATNMQIAATMAGWAFTIAQVGLAHAMAHTVGILHNVPHGAACGIVLPKVMRFNVDFAADKLAMVAQALGRQHRRHGQSRGGPGGGRCDRNADERKQVIPCSFATWAFRKKILPFAPSTPWAMRRRCSMPGRSTTREKFWSFTNRCIRSSHETGPCLPSNLPGGGREPG